VDLIAVFRNSSKKNPVAEGEVLFEQGEPGDVMYVVMSGRFDVCVGGKPVATAGPGDLLGEMALIDEEPRSATVRCTEAGEVVPVDARQFTFMVQETPTFALHVLRSVVRRIRESNERA